MPRFRTDLAMEAFDGANRHSLPGVRVDRRERDGAALTEVEITDGAAAEALGKPVGRYLTLECPGLRHPDPAKRQTVAALLAEALSQLLAAEPGAGALVVGLGNREITPDALGPAVVDRTLVTRHLTGDLAPAEDLRPVSAIAPGVLGVTGIETMELVESLVRLVRPGVVLCVDSLAARDSHRLGTTFQLTDAGIQPGAGVGNHRRALNRESVGAPVVAIGMPTVIHAATLARDAFDWLSREDGDAEDREAALQDMERALLGGEPGGMIVTPREIDSMIQDAAEIVATAVNRALQPGFTPAELDALI